MTDTVSHLHYLKHAISVVYVKLTPSCWSVENYQVLMRQQCYSDLSYYCNQLQNETTWATLKMHSLLCACNIRPIIWDRCLSACSSFHRKCCCAPYPYKSSLAACGNSTVTSVTSCQLHSGCLNQVFSHPDNLNIALYYTRNWMSLQKVTKNKCIYCLKWEMFRKSLILITASKLYGTFQFHNTKMELLKYKLCFCFNVSRTIYHGISILYYIDQWQVGGKTLNQTAYFIHSLLSCKHQFQFGNSTLSLPPCRFTFHQD